MKAKQKYKKSFLIVDHWDACKSPMLRYYFSGISNPAMEKIKGNFKESAYIIHPIDQKNLNFDAYLTYVYRKYGLVDIYSYYVDSEFTDFIAQTLMRLGKGIRLYSLITGERKEAAFNKDAITIYHEEK